MNLSQVLCAVCRQLTFKVTSTSLVSPFQAELDQSTPISNKKIICATTNSKTVVFDDQDLSPGVHINAVGSYTPHAREIPVETVARAAVYVDSREAAWSEAGDLIQPLEAVLITRDHVRAELGD